MRRVARSAGNADAAPRRVPGRHDGAGLAPWIVPSGWDLSQRAAHVELQPGRLEVVRVGSLDLFDERLSFGMPPGVMHASRSVQQRSQAQDTLLVQLQRCVGSGSIHRRSGDVREALLRQLQVPVLEQAVQARQGLLGTPLGDRLRPELIGSCGALGVGHHRPAEGVDCLLPLPLFHGGSGLVQRRS